MEKNQQLKIERVPIDKLIPDANNTRVHNQKNLEGIKSSIAKFGSVQPLVVQKSSNVIIGGNGRLEVMKELGYKEVDVVYVDTNNTEATALSISLNRTSDTSSFDLEKLGVQLQALREDDWELSDLGFSIDDLVDLKIDGYSSPEKEAIEDDVPEIKEEIWVKPGDMFQLGDHRLLCGDCTIKENVDRLMDGQKADMVFTDPPYSVNYTKKNKEIFGADEYCEIQNDAMSVEETSQKIWSPCFKNIYEVAKDDCSIYCTMPQGGDQMMMMMMMMMMQGSWLVKHELIWVKEAPVFSMGRLDYDYKHEPILYGWKKKHNFYGKGQFTKSVWDIKRDGKKEHQTMKPIALIENALLNSSKCGQLCIDPFLGSGSTLIACEKTGRKCYGMELDCHYVEVILERWKKYSGKEYVKL